MNGVLPKNISVRQTEVAADDFHARYDAHSKMYEYRILNQPTRPALDRLRVWQIAKPLDVNLMRDASRHVLGQHDCTSFQGPAAGTKNPVCTIERIDCLHDGPLIRFTIQADRFLKQMVRALVGTLVEIGHGKRGPDALVDHPRSQGSPRGWSHGAPSRALPSSRPLQNGRVVGLLSSNSEDVGLRLWLTRPTGLRLLSVIPDVCNRESRVVLFYKRRKSKNPGSFT